MHRQGSQGEGRREAYFRSGSPESVNSKSSNRYTAERSEPPRPAQNVYPVTNGTSPPKRLPDHQLATFGSGFREMRRGRQHPFFFVHLLAL